jgi:hypothetical protein
MTDDVHSGTMRGSGGHPARSDLQVGDNMTQVTQLRIISDSETFSASTKYVKPKMVEAVFSLRRDKDAPRYEKKAVFNFSAVTEEELFLLAMYACKVKAQALLRALSVDVMLNPQTLSQIDVKQDLLLADKAPGDPVSAAVKSIIKATGLDETAAKGILDQAKQKAEKAKGAGPIKTLLKAS